MTDDASAEAQPKTPARKRLRSLLLRRINIVVAGLACLFLIVVVAIGGVFSLNWQDAGLFRIAVIFAALNAVLLVIIVIVQGTDSYRAPTDQEIGKDLLAALWGVGFGVPLIFVSLSGQATPSAEWRDPLLLLLLSLVYPAIRPRRV